MLVAEARFLPLILSLFKYFSLSRSLALNWPCCPEKTCALRFPIAAASRSKGDKDQ